MNKTEIDTRAKKILANMTLREKIGQVTQIYYDSNNFDSVAAAIRDFQPGSLILAGSALAGNEKQNAVKRDKIDSLQKIAVNETKNGIPIIFGRDIIHGHSVVFPNPLNMSCSFEFDFVRRCYDAIREEAIKDGVKWTFAPMLDLSRDPRWGRIIEGAGEDSYIAECFAAAAVKGFQTEDLSNEGAMAACAKHFVGYGASEGGRDYNHTEIGDYLLHNSYLPAFRAAVKAGVATVMSSFNDINSVPVTGNRYILTDILRGKLGFEGFVVSDWAGIRQMTDFSGFARDKKDAAALALKAGVDLDMVDNCYLNSIEDLINEGTVTIDELDTAVLRILRVKLKMGLFEHPIQSQVPYDLNEHLELAQRMAEKSMVLLKNKNNILPLSKKLTVGVAGPLLHNKTELIGAWAVDPDMSLIKSPYEAMCEAAPEAKIVANPDNLADEIMFLRTTDCIVLFLGESRRVTGEATGAALPQISKSQLAVIEQAHRTGKPVIGVLCYGRPVALGEADIFLDAIIYAGHLGTRAAEAMAAVLFGDAEPTGRLSFTLPYSIGQIPLYYNTQPGARQINGYYKDENPYHRNYQDMVGYPSYPFGYGLSYTTFEYSDFECIENRISLEALKNGESFRFKLRLKNTGDRFGTAVTELYVRDCFATRMRPLRQLRRFDKTELNSGADAEIIFEIGYEDLGFYLENGDFIAEKGEFKIYIGESCYADERFTIEIV